MTNKLLEFCDVVTGYGRVKVLHGLQLHVQQGEIVCLLGANGAGKSTTLMSIGGKPRLWSGKILYRGIDVATYAQHDLVKNGISFVPEGRNIFTALTVRENILLAGQWLPKEQFRQNFIEVLAMFPRLEERLAQNAGTLSGGEQQMLAIARGLITKPSLLLLDEPSLGLAPNIIREIFVTLQKLRSEKMGVLLIEQNAMQALKIADRGYVLELGRIINQNTSAQLRNDPQVVQAYLGGHG